MTASPTVTTTAQEVVKVNPCSRFVEFETKYGIVVRLEVVGYVDPIISATLVFPTGDENPMAIKDAK